MNTENSKTNEPHRFRLTLAVNNNYQQASKVLLTFVLNKQIGQLITIAAHSLTILNTTNTEFSFIEVWFTSQNRKQFELEDHVNMTLKIRLII